MDMAERNGKENKKKISPFLYIVGGEGSENRPFWN
jgi:hypothetical protein